MNETIDHHMFLGTNSVTTTTTTTNFLSDNNFIIGGGNETGNILFGGSGVGNSLCSNISSGVNLTFSTLDIQNCTTAALFPVAPHKYRLYEFIVNGFGITIVAILGVLGNGISAIVLSRPQMRSSVTCLLLGLAFCDSLLVFTSTLLFGLFSLSDFMGTLTTYRLVYHPLWVPILYPISISAQTASVYLTLAVTLERYVAVCHPLRARSLCTWRRARYCVVTVLLFAITYNLPRWWEVRTVEGYNWTYNMTMFENDMSPMRANAMYIKIYINWAYLVVMYMVPFTGLVAFNLAIYRQVRKANRERQVLSKLQRREMGLATMLLCVVVVFLLCNVLPLVNNILESFYNMSIDHLVQTSNFLVVFNSSVNFVIYCTCGERFRRLLLRLCRDFLWCRLGIRGSRRSSLYRKSHLYRGQHVDSSYVSGIVNRLASGRSVRTSLTASFIHDRNRNRRSEIRKCGDFEDVSLASVANNHTCITTSNGNGNGNGTVIVDLTKERSNNLRHCRNKTIPMSHNYHKNNHNGDGVVVVVSSNCGGGGGGGPGIVGGSVGGGIVGGGGGGVGGNGGPSSHTQNGKLYRSRRVSSPTPTSPNPS